MANNYLYLLLVIISLPLARWQVVSLWSIRLASTLCSPIVKINIVDLRVIQFTSHSICMKLSGWHEAQNLYETSTSIVLSVICITQRSLVEINSVDNRRYRWKSAQVSEHMIQLSPLLRCHLLIAIDSSHHIQTIYIIK